MTADTATASNVNTTVQQIIPMIQSATNALSSASGTGSGDPVQLIGSTISVCIYFYNLSIGRLTSSTYRAS